MANQLPITTIVPFGNLQKLPACAAACIHLYDANGACVPPAVPSNNPSAYTSCFCFDPRLTAFSTTTGGVCDTACTANPSGLSSITSWYHSMCNVQKGAAPSTTSSTASTSTNAIPIQSHASSGDWISNHWQWVIFIVVLVVGIAGIWIGACIWRRRYIRKRDLRKQAGITDSWGSGAPATDGAAGGIPMTTSATPALPTFTSTSEKRNTTTKLWPFSSNRS
ncbi:hypothetical protein TGAM01_v204118 [Trichoderma gamsii]|uniref:Integral membrane protein n=1 Tax=Trichoderma gamsii TaxID=398673 RepID=A0A2P4ZS98_9HYPO|nr:hypothetical protein TGAM01_v204118 [Trichoderma gamsii]PON27169.1 hypothetical protein TGAM01_v204118 [Trichoderma gamsii]